MVLRQVLCHVTRDLEPTTRGMTAPGFKDTLRRSLALLAASHGGAGLTAEEAMEQIPTVLSRRVPSMHRVRIKGSADPHCFGQPGPCFMFGIKIFV